MKDRIRQLMESLHMNQQTFANHIHIGTATLSSILLGRTRPTLNTVEAIQKYCPAVNLGWLMNGQGDMFATQDSTLSQDSLNKELETYDQGMDLFAGQDSSQQSDLLKSGTSDGISIANCVPGSSSSQMANQSPQEALSSQSHRSIGGQVQDRSSRHQVQNFDISMKNIDKYTRHITEIRVYYDDQTWETFVPQK